MINNTGIFSQLFDICRLGGIGITIEIATSTLAESALAVTLRTDGDEPMKATLVVENTLLTNIVSPSAADTTIANALYSNAQKMCEMIITKRGQ